MSRHYLSVFGMRIKNKDLPMHKGYNCEHIETYVNNGFAFNYCPQCGKDVKNNKKITFDEISDFVIDNLDDRIDVLEDDKNIYLGEYISDLGEDENTEMEISVDGIKDAVNIVFIHFGIDISIKFGLYLVEQ